MAQAILQTVSAQLSGWKKDPVGIIICQGKGAEEVHYALGGISNHIFVAEYKVKLPSEEEIKNALVNKESK